MTPRLSLVHAETAAHLDNIRTLFSEYWHSFGFTPCFQGFDEELANLPGKYAPPDGRPGLAIVGDAPVGCVALRRTGEDRFEAERLYVRPQSRGHGAGRALLEWAISEARAGGYRELMGDTMPVMRQALEMYERIGFRRTGPYADDATPGAIYLCFRL